MNSLLLFAGVIVATWNGNWFPSGRAEHRAEPTVEAATIKAAGKMLARGVAVLDPKGTNDLIICVNEVRGPRVARELAKETGRTNLVLAAYSGYRRRDRFDQQQDVILTTLPVVEANWSLWKHDRKVQTPRGYAHAALVISPAVTADVYAVHLKSNYGATTAEKRQANVEKRTAATVQLAAMAKTPKGKKAKPIIVAGDFNADPWKDGETEFAPLIAAGFADALALLPADKRGTHPSKKWGDSALDHVMYRGFAPKGSPRIEPSNGLSDHNALFVILEELP